MAGINSWFYDSQMSSKLQKTGFVVRFLKGKWKLNTESLLCQGDNSVFSFFTFPHPVFAGSCMNAASIMQMA